MRYVYNKMVGINMRKPFADGNTGEEGHRQICVIWIKKSMDHPAQIVVVGGTGRVFKDKTLRSVHRMHEIG